MVDPFASGDSIPRDTYGRPRVIPLGGGKLTAYTRCTTFVGCLEDTYNLGKWQQRKTVEGIAADERESLGALRIRAMDLGPEPSKSDPLFPFWRTEMDQITKEAMDASKAKAKADLGTALHKMTERADRGEPDPLIDPETGEVMSAQHLANYRQATKDFTNVHIEAFTVHDGFKIGGTPDRVIRIAGMNGSYIADVKTGDISFGVGKMAMQLAVYAHSKLYSPEGTRTAIPDINLDRGVIIALDAETGQCRLQWIDIRAGWDAVYVAAQVREWRKRKNLMSDFVGPMRLKTEPLHPLNLSLLINQSVSNAQLLSLWERHKGDAWTDEHTDLARLRKAEIAASVLTH